jgi:hypothetical protein
MSSFAKLPAVVLRVTDTFYMYNGEARYWNGKDLHCEHKERRGRCEDCIATGKVAKWSGLCLEKECASA